MNPNFELVYQGNLRTLAKHLKSSSVIETDAPIDNHGKGERFSPTDLFSVSLASCMMTIMGIKANEKNINLENTKIDIQKVMKDQPRRVGEIYLVFYFDKALSIRKEEQIILERCAHTCPVKYSIHPDIKLDVIFKW